MNLKDGFDSKYIIVKIKSLGDMAAVSGKCQDPPRVLGVYILILS